MKHESKAINLPRLVSRILNVEKQEMDAVFWSFLYFFSIMCSYNILRPIREEMGISSGLENLRWLFLGSFVVMLLMTPLFGWITGKSPRSRYLPISYLFFAINLIIFYLFWKNGVSHRLLAQSFYIWISIFNLFVISVFWSYMTDIFSEGQSKRLFALIASGGTIGALIGPLFTAYLIRFIPVYDLLLVSACFLLGSIVAIRKLAPHEKVNRATTIPKSTPKGLSGLNGLILIIRSKYLQRICLLIALYGILATFLYFQQLEIISSQFSDSNQRTMVFAWIDVTSNGLTLAFQILFTGRIIKWFGLSFTLALIPLLLLAGFTLISLSPTLPAILLLQVLRRAGNQAIMRPARETLYVSLSKQEKYQAKNFIDTTVYRGSDALGAGIYSALGAIGMGISQIAIIAAPLAWLWAFVAYGLGKTNHNQTHTINPNSSPNTPIPSLKAKTAETI